jgi:hypothetical protein
LIPRPSAHGICGASATGAREARRIGRLGCPSVGFLDGVYGPARDGKGTMFHPAPAPSQEDIEQLVDRASKQILRFLQV